MSLGDDDTVREPILLDSAMDTGRDGGEPGDRPDEGPLSDDERALLDQLAHDDGADVVTDAPEDSPEAARAVADDAPLPGPAPTGGSDADTPQFRDAPDS